MEPDDDVDSFLLTCNYATTNVINFPIYKSCSESDAECKNGKNPAFRNLCSTNEMFDVNSYNITLIFFSIQSTGYRRSAFINEVYEAHQSSALHFCSYKIYYRANNLL